MATFPAANKGYRLFELAFPDDGPQPTHDCVPQNATQTQLGCSPCDLFHVEVVIDHTGGAALQCLSPTYQRPNVAIIRGQRSLNRPHDPVESVWHDQRDTFLQTHADMGMAVYKAREYDLPSSIYPFGVRIPSANLIRLPDGSDALSRNGYTSVHEDVTLGIHGDDGRILNKQVFVHGDLLHRE